MILKNFYSADFSQVEARPAGNTLCILKGLNEGSREICPEKPAGVQLPLACGEFTMKKTSKSLSLLLVLLLLCSSLFGCAVQEAPRATAAPAETVHVELLSPASDSPSAETPSVEVSLPEDPSVDEDGVYTTKEDVALYIHTYGCLPSNFVTKAEARDAGWSGGSLEKYLPGMCIGGDRFGNREGLLPDAKGRTWTECDVNTLGASSRGAERIVFSNDGLIYYTGDHYESFELLYD